MNIAINPFSKESIVNGLKLANAYRDSLEAKCETVCQQLTARGFSVTKAVFANAEYDGSRDVTVTLEKSDNTYRIVARGKSVAFIEFGTGIKMNPQGNSSYYGNRPEGIVGIGQYGKKLGSTGHKWHYGKDKSTYGNPPAMAMYRGEQEMLKEVMQIVRGVFT